MEGSGKRYACKVFVSGAAEGEALVIKRPLSFLGEVDSLTGDYLLDPVRRANVAGRILIIPYAVGSAGGSRILLQLVKRNRQPNGLICTRTPDTILTEGAILGRIPLVSCEDVRILEEVEDGDIVIIRDESREIIVRSLRTGRI